MPNEEEWLPAAGFPDYAVSSLGRVKRVNGGRGATPGRVLKPQRNSHGYQQLTLCRDGERKNVSVHVLVAETFLGPAPPDCEVRRRDGDRFNPRLSNLVWGTRTENVEDARNHGTWISGERNGQAKLTERQVLEIKKRALAGESRRALGKEFGVNQSLVGAIKLGKRWSYLAC